ncbi:anthrone oxygenase family protein [Paenibacillus chitinolyticus]
MSGSLLTVLTFCSALGSGLNAGLFFAFSAFVMTALARIPAEQGIAAMQSINATILNPLFGIVFMGTALLSGVLAVSSLLNWGEPGSGWLLAGSLVYAAGFAVTMVFNVPLNNALEAVNPGSAAGADVWSRYVIKWTAWNHVRTAACLAALAMFIQALRLKG